MMLHVVKSLKVLKKYFLFLTEKIRVFFFLGGTKSIQDLCEPQDTYSGTKLHRLLEYLKNQTGLTYFAGFDRSPIQKEKSAERNTFLCAEMPCIKNLAHPMLLNIILTVSFIHVINATKIRQQQYSSALHFQDFHKSLIYQFS